MWTIPTIPTVVAPYTDDTYFKGVTGANLEDAYHSCVLRIRYNLSSSDFPSVSAHGCRVRLGLTLPRPSGQWTPWRRLTRGATSWWIPGTTRSTATTRARRSLR